jgi:hypothetical protein
MDEVGVRIEDTFGEMPPRIPFHLDRKDTLCTERQASYYRLLPNLNLRSSSLSLSAISMTFRACRGLFAGCAFGGSGAGRLPWLCVVAREDWLANPDSRWVVVFSIFVGLVF